MKELEIDLVEITPAKIQSDLVDIAYSHGISENIDEDKGSLFYLAVNNLVKKNI